MFRRFFGYAMDAAVLVAPDFSFFKNIAELIRHKNEY
jgi:hypothetical protein